MKSLTLGPGAILKRFNMYIERLILGECFDEEHKTFLL